MTDDKIPAITSKWEAVCEVGKDIELPLGGQINGFKGYHYDEMIKRLNNVDKGEIGSVGYLLRKLWKRHESGLVMHETNVYSSQHEQSQKANKDEFEKRYKKKEIGFRKNESGVWGVYSDLLYDTYQKDWSKAYQLTFHYFFRNMDYLSNYMDNEFFSYVHSDVRFFAFGKKCQFGEVIIKESDNLIGSKAKLDEIHGLPNHSKAPLYDIIYVVLGSKGHSDRDREQFRHGYGYWLGSTGNAADLPKILSMEVFGHMASVAVVNPKAFEAMKKYLPKSYEMFIGILRVMVLRLEDVAINNYKEQESRNDKLPLKKPIKLPLNYEDINNILGQEYKSQMSDSQFQMSERVKNVIKDMEKNAKDKYKKEYYEDLAKKMVSIYLDEELKDSNKKSTYKRELTYLIGKKCKKEEMYVGYYDHSRIINTMGKKFSEILSRLNPKIVVHLHPEFTKNDRSYLRWQSMFSPGDRGCMAKEQEWIGIEFYKEKENDSFYTIDIHYCSREMLIGMLEAGYEDNAREYETDQVHKERIEDLKKKNEIKFINDYINWLDTKSDGKASEKMSYNLKCHIIFLPSIKLYSIKDFKKSENSKRFGFKLESTEDTK